MVAWGWLVVAVVVGGIAGAVVLFRFGAKIAAAAVSRVLAIVAAGKHAIEIGEQRFEAVEGAVVARAKAAEADAVRFVKKL